MLLTSFQEHLGSMNFQTFFEKTFKWLLMDVSRILYSVAGVFSYYMFALLVTNKHQIPERWVDFNKLCFGIYLIQQFILQYLYYHTSLPALTGTYLLPWVGFMATILLSTVIVRLLLKTKVGLFLIG